MLAVVAVAAVLIVVIAQPAAVLAGPVVLPLTIGASTPGTLTVVPQSSVYVSEYSVHLNAGQTLVATYTPSSAITQPAMAMWAPFATDVPMLFRNVDRQDPRSPTTMYLLAPRTATYRLRVAGQSVASTFTIDTAVVPALSFSLSPTAAPKYVVRNSWFRVTTNLNGTFDQLNNPVRFVVQRKVGRWWRTYRTAKPLFDSRHSDYAGVLGFRANLRLPQGTFRVRAAFSDAAHLKAQYNGWKTITVGKANLTELPSGMDPKVALTTYLQAVSDENYGAAFALLPVAQKRAYGSAGSFGTQVSQYGITGYAVGPVARKGSTVTIVSQQATPAMNITYTWTYVRVAGSWFVKSRAMGGTI